VKRLFPGLNDVRFRRFIEMLGGLSGRILNYAEADLVLDGDFGLVAVEIKHASAIGQRDLKSLDAFVREYGARLGVVVGNAREPRLLGERLVSLPFTHL